MNTLLDRPGPPGPAAATPAPRPPPFVLEDEATYRRWRDAKLALRPQRLDELIIDVADPRALSAAERAALLQCCARANFAVYRSPLRDEDPALPLALGRQLGLQALDTNWLAEEDGLSRIEVGDGRDGEGRGGFIPYSNRAIGWHTDGYYHPAARRIRGMILHCVRPAASGGESGLIDHELAYIALRDADPAWVRALMAPDAMTIPARLAEDGSEARAAQAGPVFAADPAGGRLHMRYTARTRSIVWKDDAATAAAVAFLERWLASAPAWRLRLAPGMGVVANNVLHDRAAFVDDPAAPRLLYRARYLDGVAAPQEAPWRNG